MIIYRQIIIPDSSKHNIQFPESLYGKRVEITIKEIPAQPAIKKRSRALPAGLKNMTFWEGIDYNPGFPDIEEIREKAFPVYTRINLL
jgi:hypothetical protein